MGKDEFNMDGYLKETSDSTSKSCRIYARLWTMKNGQKVYLPGICGISNQKPHKIYGRGERQKQLQLENAFLKWAQTYFNEKESGTAYQMTNSGFDVFIKQDAEEEINEDFEENVLDEAPVVA